MFSPRLQSVIDCLSSSKQQLPSSPSFVRSFVRSFFLPACVASSLFVRSFFVLCCRFERSNFVRSLLPSFVRACVRSFGRFGRLVVWSFVRSFVGLCSFLLSFPPTFRHSLLCRFAASCSPSFFAVPSASFVRSFPRLQARVPHLCLVTCLVGSVDYCVPAQLLEKPTSAR